MAFSCDVKQKVQKAFVPQTVLEGAIQGTLKGSFHENSGVLNVYHPDIPPIEDSHLLNGLCKPFSNGADGDNDFYLDIDTNGEWVASYAGEYYPIQSYDLVQSVFSRNSGLLESSQMADAWVAIFGCGSVGSYVALELARAGVGNFLLVDNDIVEYHNLCRHQCGIHEVGDYKVDAIERRILDINPLAHIEKHIALAEYVPKEIWDRWLDQHKALCIGCADNREADVFINERCLLYEAPFLSIGFWERAFAGEIFYWLPNTGMVCYRCALGDGSLSRRTSNSRRFYTTQEDIAAATFEPGIAVDIDFVTTVGIKLALDILNQDNRNFTQRLLPSLEQYTLVCNTNDPRIGGDLAEIFSYPLQITTSLKVTSSPGCECALEGDCNVRTE